MFSYHDNNPSIVTTGLQAITERSMEFNGPARLLGITAPLRCAAMAYVYTVYTYMEL